MSAQLANLYFDSELYPGEHEALSDLFESLEISTHSPVTDLLLNEIYNLILYGESITGFFESSKSLQNAKVLLKSVLDKISDIQTFNEGTLLASSLFFTKPRHIRLC